MHLKWNNFEKRTYVHEIIFLFESYDTVQIILEIWLLHWMKCTFFQFLPHCEKHV